MKYDIFISYRRNGGYETAKHLYDLLSRDGYKVSFDIDTLRAGDFDTQLYGRIDQCKDFIIIVDQHAFDRTINQGKGYRQKQDWLRCELAYALKKNKNIIPVFLQNTDGFPKNLPADISKVSLKNGPAYSKYHFDSFYDSLKSKFLKSKNHSRMRILLYSIMSLVLLSILCFFIYLYYPTKFVSLPIDDEDSYRFFVLDDYSKNESAQEYDDYFPSEMYCIFVSSNKDNPKNQFLVFVEDPDEIDSSKYSEEEMKNIHEMSEILKTANSKEYYNYVKTSVKQIAGLKENMTPFSYNTDNFSWFIYRFEAFESKQYSWRMSAKYIDNDFINITVITDEMNFLQEKRFMICLKRMLDKNDLYLKNYLDNEY